MKLIDVMNVNILKYPLLILFFFLPYFAHGAVNISTNATLGGSATEIVISGIIDAPADCPAGTPTQPYLVAGIYDVTYNPSVLLLDNELIEYGVPFSVTLTPDNLIISDTGGLIAPTQEYVTDIISLYYTDSVNTYWSDCYFVLGDYGTSEIFTLTVPPAPVIPVGGAFYTMVSDGETAFEETTGTTMGATTAWAGDNLILLFMGSGLATLFYLRYWIVALVIISVIIYFAYRAMKFQKLGTGTGKKSKGKVKHGKMSKKKKSKGKVKHGKRTKKVRGKKKK